MVGCLGVSGRFKRGGGTGGCVGVRWTGGGDRDRPRLPPTACNKLCHGSINVDGEPAPEEPTRGSACVGSALESGVGAFQDSSVSSYSGDGDATTFSLLNVFSAFWRAAVCSSSGGGVAEGKTGPGTAGGALKGNGDLLAANNLSHGSIANNKRPHCQQNGSEPAWRQNSPFNTSFRN